MDDNLDFWDEVKRGNLEVIKAYTTPENVNERSGYWNAHYNRLEYACFYNHVESVKWLLVQGASVTCTSKELGGTISSICIHRRSIESLCILIEHGVDVNEIDCHGQTILDITLISKLGDDIIITLLDYGARANKYKDDEHLVDILNKRNACKAIARIVIGCNLMRGKDMSRLLAKYIWANRN